MPRYALFLLFFGANSCVLNFSFRIKIDEAFQIIEIKRFISSEKPRDFSHQNISKQSVILHDISALISLGW